MWMDFWGVGSGEEFQLRYVLAPFKYALNKFWIWAGGGVNIREGLNKQGRGLDVFVCRAPSVHSYCGSQAM